MQDPFAISLSRYSPLRMFAAVVIGLIGAVLIWVITPYNNYILHNSYIADDYLPAAVLFLTLSLVMIFNPMLRLIRPRLSLNRNQLAVIVGIWLMACVVPGQGLLRFLPYMISKTPTVVSQQKQLAEQFEEMDLPPSLFPDKLEFGQRPQASEDFLSELPPGRGIPWDNWVGPLLSWGGFLLFAWLMMLGLTMIVLPQWRRNERLAFPLLTVQQSILDAPAEQHHLLPPLLRTRGFWVGAAVVFFIHLLHGGAIYRPESIPQFPLSWDFTELFSEDPYRHIPGHLRNCQVYFIFIGVAFFMPTRISFSIWFTMVAYGVYRMMGIAYFPPFPDGSMANHRDGAMFAVTLMILWIGRRHWIDVFGSLFRWKDRSEEARRNRNSSLMFLVGCGGMFAWLVWVGVQPGWAAALVGFAFMIALVISRIVCETGMPFVRLYGEPLGFIKMFPTSMVGPVSLYFAAIIGIFFPMGSRVNTTAMATQAMALDDDFRPRHRVRLGWLFLIVLFLGLGISGVSHVYLSYHNGQTLDGMEQPVSAWGTTRLDKAHKALGELQAGQFGQPSHSQVGHLAFGAGLAALLYWACLAIPTWPLHPVGMLLVETNYGRVAWASIFFGWVLKVLLVRFGGSRLFRAARGFFIGVIVGEVLAAIFWALVPVYMVLTNQPYRAVHVLPL